MEKKAGRHEGHRDPITSHKLQDIWRKICADRDGQDALEKLKRAGFAIAHLTAGNASHVTWADKVSAISLVPNRPAASRIHRKRAFQKHWTLVRELHRFANKLREPFCDVTISSGKDYPLEDFGRMRQDLLKTASIVEQFLSWDWYLRERNPRNSLIAELRWEIRARTGSPHDRELGALIDAAYRAAGHHDGCDIDSSALDRMEKREKEGRVKAMRRLRSAGNTGFLFMPLKT